jgi:hypothetical protein
MAAKCIECDNLADQHGLCHKCRRWYKKRVVEKYEKYHISYLDLIKQDKEGLL